MTNPARLNPSDDMHQHWRAWQECVFSHDQNSLTNQFLTQNLDYAFFLMNHEDVRILQETFPKKPPINNGFQNMLTRAFFQYQLIGIKRLRDSEHSSLDGNNAVCSLHALIADINEARQELTRSFYIQLNTNYIQTEPIDLTDSKALPLAPTRLEKVNSIFDRVSGTNAKNRSDQDVPLISYITCLTDQIKLTEPIFTIANKFSAHLATPDNRKKALINVSSDLKTLRQAFKDLYLVYGVLSRFLFSGPERLAVMPRASFARNWTSTNLDSANEKRIRAVYECMAVETDAWLDEDIPQFWAQIHTTTTNELKSQNTSKTT